MKNVTAIERFERKYYPDPNSGCWLWFGSISKHGYGEFYLGEKRYERAHRASWIFKNGEIPADLHVLHKCDVRSCVNPNHLWLGTNSDNVADMVSKKRNKWMVGSNHKRSKINEDDVLLIRAKKSVGVKTKELMDEFGLGKSMIAYICSGQYWKHVP